jgi:DNA-binding CsgD family transcriptional regulator
VNSADELAASAARTLRDGVAVLDAEGTIRWANEAWDRMVAEVPMLAGATIGARLADLYRSNGGPIGEMIAAAIESILGKHLPYVELDSPGHRAAEAVRMSFTADPAGGGAVVQFRRAGAVIASRPPLLRIDPAQLSERLTPRERDVLARLADGLDNRTIAKDLGVEYSTVRGHVRSLIEKFGARSRVDVVAIAYRTGLVRRTEAER